MQQPDAFSGLSNESTAPARAAPRPPGASLSGRGMFEKPKLAAAASASEVPAAVREPLPTAAGGGSAGAGGNAGGRAGAGGTASVGASANVSAAAAGAVPDTSTTTTDTGEKTADMEAQLARQEASVRKKMKERFESVREESAKLARIQREIDGMGTDSRKDVQIIMTKITQADKEVHAATALFKRREEEFRLAKEDKEKKEKKKKMLTEHLRLIIYENEKKKEEKLFFLMDKLGVSREDAVGFKGFDAEGKA